MVHRFERTVGEEEAGIRLDLFLARQPEVASRSMARGLVEQGHVTLSGAKPKPSLQLEAGQAVAFVIPDEEPFDPLSGGGAPAPDVPVLYEDAFLVAVNKPAGLASHPPEGKGFVGHTVASFGRARYGALPAHGGADRPGIVHRLDRDTSGVMLLARNDEAFHWLRAQFKERTALKEYHCIAYGESRFDSDWIDRPIASDPKAPDRMMVVPEGGRESTTFYEVIERFRGFTYFRCLPKTGRTHQIRVHMTSVGHSLVGDHVYRSRRNQHESLPEGAPDPGRQCLHAHRLEIPHPYSHEPIAFEAPLPADMQALLDWLRTHCRLQG